MKVQRLGALCASVFVGVIEHVVGAVCEGKRDKSSGVWHAAYEERTARCVCWALVEVLAGGLAGGARRRRTSRLPMRGSRQGVRAGLHPFDCLASISFGAGHKNRTGSGAGQAARAVITSRCAAGEQSDDGEARRQPPTTETNYHHQKQSSQ